MSIVTKEYVIEVNPFLSQLDDSIDLIFNISKSRGAWGLGYGHGPQTSDEIICFAEKQISGKLADSSRCDNAKRRSASAGFRFLTP